MRPARILVEVVILIDPSVANEGRDVDGVHDRSRLAHFVPATVIYVELLGFAIRQYEFRETLCWFTLYVRKGGHSHAAFLNFSDDRILISHCSIQRYHAAGGFRFVAFGAVCIKYVFSACALRGRIVIRLRAAD